LRAIPGDSSPAPDVQLSHPKASDDVFSGADSAEDAQLILRELQSALDSAGIPLRKWTSNHKEILADIQSDHLLTTDFLEINTESTAETLGERWKATFDEISFVPQIWQLKSPPRNAKSFPKLPSCLI